MLHPHRRGRAYLGVPLAPGGSVPAIRYAWGPASFRQFTGPEGYEGSNAEYWSKCLVFCSECASSWHNSETVYRVCKPFRTSHSYSDDLVPKFARGRPALLL